MLYVYGLKHDLFNPLEIPKIQISKKEIQLQENGSFSVECSADGVPTPTVHSILKATITMSK